MSTAVAALAVAPACTGKREPPQQSPTSGTGFGSTVGAGGSFTVGSGASTTAAGPSMDVDHCSCIYASQHVAKCEACAADAKTGVCDTAWQACEADPDCPALATFCVASAANDGATIDACLGAPGKVRSLLENYFDCLCAGVHCSFECDDSDQCGGSTSSSSTTGASTSASTSASSTSASGSTGSGTGGAP